MASYKSKSGSSYVWKFYTVTLDKQEENNITATLKAKCNLCHELISRGGKYEKLCNTTNLQKHLYSKHNEEVKTELKLIEEEKKLKKKRESEILIPVPKKLRNQTLPDLFAPKKLWDINNSQAKALHQRIGEMIAIDSQPYSVVEDIGFQRVLKTACPNYVIPSRRYFSETIIPNIYKSVRENVQAILDAAESISFTSDIWTSSTANTPFLSLTGHCLTKDFEQKVAVLRVAYFPESHTGSNIKDMILKSIDEFNIPHYKVHLIARDNGANMVKGIRETGFSALPCFLHTLQLILHDSIFEQKYMKDIITNCRTIVTHFNHSPQAVTKLAKLQEQLKVPQHKLLQDVPTRWNSTYAMLERIFEQKGPIGLYCIETDGIPVLDSNKWNLVGKMVELLSQFEKITKRLSNKESIVSEIIPNIRFIKMYITKVAAKGLFVGLGSTIIALKNSIETRCSNYTEDKNMILATFLDPRFKKKMFESSNSRTSTDIEMLLSMMVDTLESMVTKQKLWETGDDNEENSGDSNPENILACSSNIAQDSTIGISTSFDFSQCCEELILESPKVHQSTVKVSNSVQLLASVRLEVEKYISSEMIHSERNPLIWWKEYQKDYKYLNILAKVFLSSPPSSVESERLFSFGGLVYTPKRNRLSPNNGEQLMFLNYNLRLLNMKY